MSYGTQVVTATGTPALTNVYSAKQPVENYSSFTVSGTYTGITFTVEASTNAGPTTAGTWFQVGVIDAAAGSFVTGGTAITPASNATKNWIIPLATNLTGIRLNVSAYSTGTMTANFFSDALVGSPNYNAISATTTNTTLSGATTVTSSSADAFDVGANGTTNPVLKVNANTASVATGVTLVGAAAGSGVAVQAISSGTNEALTIDAKAAAAITLAGGAASATGVIVGSATSAANAVLTVVSSNAAALSVGANGATNPALKVNANTASSATGISITSAAAAAGAAVAVISSGTNENLTLDAKGSGTITLASVSTGNFVIGASKVTIAPASGNLSSAGSILSTSATGGVGYATGAGGAVTQATSRTTGVTLNTPTGAITLVSAAGSATPASFTVTNSSVAATDVVVVSQKSGTDLYEIFVTAVAAGSFKITSFTTGGTTTEQPVFSYTVLKGVTS